MPYLTAQSPTESELDFDGVRECDYDLNRRFGLNRLGTRSEKARAKEIIK